MAASPMDPFDPTPEQPGPARDASPAAGARPPYRPPIGIPLERPSRWAGPVSLALHTLLLLAILAPLLGSKVLPTLVQGAGGPGPAGGGGGGRQGSGGGERVVERLRYIQTAPAPPPAPVPDPLTPPVPEPPVEEKKPEPQQAKIDVKLDVPNTTVADLALTAGIGGGTGNDGSNGNGPGSGGGVGSGVGTGRGSGEGPGSGGGPGTIFLPKLEFTLIPPMPVPGKVKGRTVVAHFSIDERGVVTKVELNPDSGDSGYNRRLRELFMEYKFKPATTWDGKPVAVVFPVTFTL